jgi:hypothetical protein
MSQQVPSSKVNRPEAMGTGALFGSAQVAETGETIITNMENNVTREIIDFFIR